MEQTSETAIPTEHDGAEHNGVHVFDLDEQIGHLIRRAHQRASATFMSVLADHRFTPTQFFALVRLREKRQLSQNKLGRMTAMDPATIQGVARRLDERGYIERLPDTKDRRRMVLRLTEAGHETVEKLLDEVDAVSQQFLAPLAPDEQEQFRSLLKRIV